VNVSYWYQNTYSVNTGLAERLRVVQFGAVHDRDHGEHSANGKPNSNAFIIEADRVPFGRADSRMSPRANVKLGRPSLLTASREREDEGPRP
jgi:hypothetical protein